VKAEALDRALEQSYVPPAPPRSPLQPMGAGLSEVVEECARSLARKHRLIDRDGQLHCWQCGGPIGWHVSLLCPLCRADAPRRKREQEAKERAERERQRLEEQEQSRPVQRVANRSFRDEY